MIRKPATSGYIEEMPMNVRRISARVFLALLLMLAVLSFPRHLPAQTAGATASAAEKPFVVEYYYKVRWGYADEFIGRVKRIAATGIH